ncbi:SDR family oxidoreductase [Amycolatopsis rhizosphaerae]|uniref:SDR family oxidoreductase n=1 Tax=Amycolatopsis rhizosphaerae TaxID=2053003 RepID=A0A558C546_9PSEU|nr:SDR family oxidoreductase [Amycolatopsis rhizosphaerae]
MVDWRGNRKRGRDGRFAGDVGPATGGCGRADNRRYARGRRRETCGRTEPENPLPGAEFLRCDVREPEQVAHLVAEMAARHGRLDVLVDNAGGAPHEEAAKAGVDNLTASLAVECAPKGRVNASV